MRLSWRFSCCPLRYGIAWAAVCISVVCRASLPYMSIRTGVVVAVAFQQVNRAPDAKAGTESHNEGLKYSYCAVEKCHKIFPPFLKTDDSSCLRSCLTAKNLRAFSNPFSLLSAVGSRLSANVKA